MNIKRAKEEIKRAVRAYLEKDEWGEYRIPQVRQRPVLLIGPPGIGKTQIMEQIAAECDLALAAYTITHHTRQSAIGLPFIREEEYGGETKSVTKYTMSEIIASMYDRMEASGKKEGILFIDEINCVSETLAPTMLQFLQGKTFGNQKIPEGWIIVAAGNPPEYNKSVRQFDVVTLDRVKMIHVEADYAVWKEYAYAVNIHGAVISYLDIHKENFYRMETTVDGKMFVTARGWEDLSEMLYAYERLGLSVDQEMVMQYLQHSRVAKDFANYYELYNKYKQDYQIDEILAGTIRPATLNKLKYAPFDEHLEVIGLLLARLSENFETARRLDSYIGRLFALLKEIKPQLADRDGDVLLGEQIQKLTEEMESRKAAGQGDRALLKESRKLVGVLEKLREQVKEKRGDADGTWDVLREGFAAERDALEDAERRAGDQLEAAFDFMEVAFGESQEMVVFITELTAGRGGIWYIREHDCDRYHMYNKSLLFAGKDAQIRGMLDDIRGMQIKE